MAKQWWRIDKQDGAEEPLTLEQVSKAAAAYYKDAHLAMSCGTFQTPFAIYEYKDVPEGTTTDF